MINVLLDENNYYTGNYANVGKIEGGVDVESLPPVENQTCYFLEETEEPKEIEIEKIAYYKLTTTMATDENGDEKEIETAIEITEEEAANDENAFPKPVLDEDGNPVMETITITEKVQKWILDENKITEQTQVILQSLKDAKNKELNDLCTKQIYSGIDIETTVGTEHFSLTDVDQLNIKALYDKALSGDASLLYHSDGNLCRLFTSDEIIALMNAALYHVTYYTTLCNHLHVQVNNMRSEARINEVQFDVSSLSDSYKESFNAIINSLGGN